MCRTGFWAVLLSITLYNDYNDASNKNAFSIGTLQVRCMKDGKVFFIKVIIIIPL